MYRAPAAEELFVIRTADRVETFRVHPLERVNFRRGGREKDFEEFGVIGQFFITRVGPLLTSDQQAAVAALLLDEKGYWLTSPGNAKKCVFTPRHSLRFCKGNEVVEALICFDCKQLRLGSGGGDFDSMALPLSELFREVGLYP
jgi:hypothetical protein